MTSDIEHRSGQDLRHTIINHNLNRHLPPAPLRILDVGGGSGGDAIRLAAAGHTVTLVDYSGAMLRLAQQEAEARGVADRIRIHYRKLDELPSLFSAPEFDAVLFHNVIQYVEDGAEALRQASAPLKPGGLISVSGVNRYSDAYREALLWQRLDNAYALLADSSKARPYSGEEIVELLDGLGCEVLGHYGVGCVSDYIAAENSPAALAELQRLEIAMSDRYPYYLLARAFQVIAVRR